MTEDTATKANDKTAKRPAARLLSAVSKLKSAAVGAIARHQRREALLRVHRATRQDGRINGTGTDDAARGPKPPRASADSGIERPRPRPLARIANRLRRFFDAHAARLHELRVYDRKRG